MKNQDEVRPSEYESPRVVDYGNLTELTAGSSNGDYLDSAFPINTPKRDLTFSNGAG